MTLEQLEALNAEQKARTVLVVQDPFTSYYDAQVVADFVRLVEKLGFQPVLLPFSPNGKPSISKLFLIVCEDGEKDGGFPQPYGEAGDANGGRSGAGTLLSMNINWRWARNVASLTSYWRMNGWQAPLTHSQWLQSAVNHVVFLWSLYRSYRALPGAPAQWAAMLPIFGAKLENIGVGCCGMAGTYGHEAKNHKIRSGSMSYPGIRRCSDCRVIAVWRPDIPAVAR
ncbi:hypothetical protein MJ581_09740 [Escherichia coli]|nr:hypothetical protein MJ581_09740 [Escherichia coli]